MESVLERKAMVNSVNDSSKFIDSEVKLQRPTVRQNETVTSEVNFSDISQQISALKKMVLNSSEINHTRVQILKEQLNSGRYEILSHHIAERMHCDFQLV